MTRRIVLAVVLILATLIPGTAARATAPTRASVLASWTQSSAASYAAWNTARLDRERWASYGFDWGTDYCTASPDNPLGFPFATACWRHDFGYRNYRAAGQFAANKARIDTAFHADLRRVCATYRVVLRSACYSLAWTYYQAVSVFGSLARVPAADLDRAERLLHQSA